MALYEPLQPNRRTSRSWICTGFLFPLTYAEKGLLQVKLHGPGWDDLPLQAGQALNVVPDKATYAGHRLRSCFLFWIKVGFSIAKQKIL